jgi:hypothetical protein
LDVAFADIRDEFNRLLRKAYEESGEGWAPKHEDWLPYRGRLLGRWVRCTGRVHWGVDERTHYRVLAYMDLAEESDDHVNLIVPEDRGESLPIGQRVAFVGQIADIATAYVALDNVELSNVQLVE